MNKEYKVRGKKILIVSIVLLAIGAVTLILGIIFGKKGNNTGIIPFTIGSISLVVGAILYNIGRTVHSMEKCRKEMNDMTNKIVTTMKENEENNKKSKS